MSEINLAVIGVGKIFQSFHLSSILSQSEINIRYVVDKNESLVKRVSQQTGSKPLSDISLIEGCDMCFIATPPATRMQIYKSLESSGMDFIFEKPIAFSSKSASEIIENVNKNGGNVYVTQTRRFFSNLCLIRKFLSNQMFGEIESIEINEGGVFSWVTESNYMNALNQEDMGVLHDIGSHVLDYITIALSEYGISSENAVINQSVVDHEIMSNNFYCEIDFDGVNVKVRLSRNLLLLNQLKIVFKNGVQLTTESGYSNTVYLRKQGELIRIDVQDEDIKAFTFESVFDNLWANIVSNKLKGCFLSDYHNILSDTVLPSVRLLDNLISVKQVKPMDIYFKSYGCDGIK